MTAIEVHFLTGRCCATAHHDRMQAEWPPHGARLFSAMVATWAEAEPPDEGERSALEWLETLPPPRITAAGIVPRRVVKHFVPVNDASVISPSQYRNRAEKLEGEIAQFEDEIESTQGELTKKVNQLLARIDKTRDVASMTEKAGKTNPASALVLLPDGRTKKERYFPSVTLLASQPSDDSQGCAPASSEEKRDVLAPPVTYAWDDTAPPEIAEALDGLLARVTRLGHSSSLVSCRLNDDAPEATHTPGEGSEMLRWVMPGQLSALEERHQQHQGIQPRSLPFRGVRYREQEAAAGDEPLIPATAGEWIVFELEPQSRRRPVTCTVELCRVLRESLFSHVPDPLPEGVSGHRPNGRPTTSPHIAFLALPNVGYEYSDGRIMGLAISLPHNLDKTALKATLSGIDAWERKRGRNGRALQLRMGRKGDVMMRRRRSDSALVSLRRGVWAKSSRLWTSATPMALPTHPGDLSRGSPAARAKAWARASEAIAKSCAHVGLPPPVDVRVSFVSHLQGARPARDFPVFRQGGHGNRGTARRLLHTTVEFADEVKGPLMLGSGRFMGLGLMRPVIIPTENADGDTAETDQTTADNGQAETGSKTARSNRKEVSDA